MAEVRAAEEAEAKRAALDPENEARRRKAVIGLGGKMAWGDGIMEAMEKVAKRSDEGWVVVLVCSIYCPLAWLTPSGDICHKHRGSLSAQVGGLHSLAAGLKTASQITSIHLLLLPDTAAGIYCACYQGADQ